MKAKAECDGNSVEYVSLCTAFKSMADNILIEAWVKLGKPKTEITVKLESVNKVTGVVKIGLGGLPYPSDFSFTDGANRGQR